MLNHVSLFLKTIFILSNPGDPRRQPQQHQHQGPGARGAPTREGPREPHCPGAEGGTREGGGDEEPPEVSGAGPSVT